MKESIEESTLWDGVLFRASVRYSCPGWLTYLPTYNHYWTVLYHQDNRIHCVCTASYWLVVVALIYTYTPLSLKLAAEFLLISDYNDSSRQTLSSLLSSSSGESADELLRIEALLKELEGLTLYDFLVELFGERLVLKLERYAYTQRTPAVMDSVTRPHSEVKKGFMISSERMQALIDVSFRRCQAREGFVSSPQTVRKGLWTAGRVHPRLTGQCQPFSVKTYHSPIIGNVLEEERKRPMAPLANGCVMKGRMLTENKRRQFASSSLACVTSCIL